MKFISRNIICHIYRCVLCGVCLMLMSGECGLYMDPPDNAHIENFEVINITSDTIYSIGSDASFLMEPQIYFPERFEDLCLIKPLESNAVYQYLYFDLDKSYNGYFQFLFFKKSTIEGYTYQEIIEHNIFDKRIIISYDDLKANDFKIVYTGD